MAGSALKKITTRAKAIYKKGGTWKGAIKKAGVEYRSGKISGVKRKKVGAVKRKKVGAVKRRKVGAVKRKRVGAVKRKKVGSPRKVGSIATHKAAARAMVKEALGWNMVNQSTAKTVKAKKRLAKRTAKLKKELKALS